MAKRFDAVVEDAGAPERRDGGTQRHSPGDPPAGLGAGGRREQPQAEYRAPMGVDPAGRREHGGFGFPADDPQTAHPATLGTGFRQGAQIGLDGGGTGTEVVASISAWLPESTWLTSPGFGQVSSSSRRARAAFAAIADRRPGAAFPVSRMRVIAARPGPAPSS